MGKAMTEPFIPPEAADLIKRFEGFSAKAYLDPVGVRTIGWGHVILPGENFGEITRQQGEELLMADMRKHAGWLTHYIHVPLNDSQFAAMLSLVFNLGVTPLAK